MAERYREGRADARRGFGIREGVWVGLGCGLPGWVLWVLEAGDGEAGDVGGTLMVALLVLEASVSGPEVSEALSASEDFRLLRDALSAVSLATASLMWAGTRTQANVRS